MAESLLNCENPKEADVVILAANYDRTSSFGKGADKGPEAIRECLDWQIEFYDRVSGWSPVEHKKIAWHDPGDLSQLSPEAMVQKLSQVCAEFNEKFVLLVGGEHSVTNGPLLAHAAQADDITIVQIDAHADLREDDSDYNEKPHGKFAHCAVMKRGFDLGYKLVQVGLRACSATERELFSNPRVRAFEWGHVQPEISEILKAVSTDKVYLTIDVDGFDPAVMPATGTPVPGGLGWYYTIELLRGLFKQHNVIGADVVEVAPRNGESLTEYSAAQLVYSIIGLKFADVR